MKQTRLNPILTHPILSTLSKTAAAANALTITAPTIITTLAEMRSRLIYFLGLLALPFTADFSHRFYTATCAPATPSFSPALWPTYANTSLAARTLAHDGAKSCYCARRGCCQTALPALGITITMCASEMETEYTCNYVGTLIRMIMWQCMPVGGRVRDSTNGFVIEVGLPPPRCYGLGRRMSWCGCGREWGGGAEGGWPGIMVIAGYLGLLLSFALSDGASVSSFQDWLDLRSSVELAVLAIKLRVGSHKKLRMLVIGAGAALQRWWTLLTLLPLRW